MKKEPVRLLIIDDYKLYRKALVTLIQTFGFKATFYEAANDKEGLEVISTNEIDIVILDMQMPVMSGMNAIKQIVKLTTRPYVIALTQFDEKALVTYTLKHGVNGFLSKGCEPEELKDAILGVLKDGYYHNDMTLKAPSKDMSKVIYTPTLELSTRELQVMELMKDGKSNKEISKSLGLSIRTIESYRKALMKKTQCRNVADVVRLAYRAGIVT